jgi:hypothetical protein
MDKLNEEKTVVKGMGKGRERKREKDKRMKWKI